MATKAKTTKMTKQQVVLGVANLLSSGNKPSNVEAVAGEYGAYISLNGARVQFNEVSANTIEVNGNRPRFKQQFRRGKDGRFKLDKIADAVRNSLSEQLVVRAKMEQWAQTFMDALDQGRSGAGFNIAVLNRDAHAGSLNSYPIQAKHINYEADPVEELRSGKYVTLCQYIEVDTEEGFNTDEFLFYVTIHADDDGNMTAYADRTYTVLNWERSASEELGEARATYNKNYADFPIRLEGASAEEAAETILTAHGIYAERICDLATRLDAQRAKMFESQQIVDKLQELDLPEYVTISASREHGSQVGVVIALSTSASDSQARELVSGIYALCVRLGIKATRHNPYFFR